MSIQWFIPSRKYGRRASYKEPGFTIGTSRWFYINRILAEQMLQVASGFQLGIDRENKTIILKPTNEAMAFVFPTNKVATKGSKFFMHGYIMNGLKEAGIGVGQAFTAGWDDENKWWYGIPYKKEA